MPDRERSSAIVVNTSPIVALIAGIGDLTLLNKLYDKVIVPFEVCNEITVENNLRFGAEIFDSVNWIEKSEENIKIEPLLLNLLDRGEAAVIQTAINKNIKLVCIDDAVGRRVARLNNLEITGSLGILLRGKKLEYIHSLKPVLDSMIARGIWISRELYERVLYEAGER